MKRIGIVLIICLALIHNSLSQDSTTHRKYTPKQKFVLGGLALQQVVSFGVQYKWWWKDDYHSFNFEKEGIINSYSLGVDKAGHFYTSYLYFHSLNELMQWADFTPKQRKITAVVLPLAWAVSIEIGDGFSNFGASWEDLLANSLGIGFGLVQEKYPYMRNFKVKMSYYPTAYYIDRNFKGWALTSDYRAHCYWLSFDVHNLLPQKAQRYWPEFLNMAVGYGVDPNTLPLARPNLRDFCIGLDWNLSSIKTQKKSAHLAKELLDYWHYPAPGIGKVQGEPARFILFR
ncbi:MAG: DUF2279 domain-containing protein [Bacteroidota bacterium]